MNSFNSDISDIDFLVVVKEKTDFKMKRELIMFYCCQPTVPQKALK